MKQVHGHELIGLIAKAEKALTLDEIKELAETKLGKDVSYNTCSQQAMDTDEMISFLVNRRKVVKHNGGYVVNTGEVCDHDH
jgi:probable metal-binding protein